MTAARDNKGRFIKGKSGNPNGRPPKEREEKYYEITMSTCTYKDWQAIVEKAIEQAQRGDTSARTWLSNYLVGVPEQHVDGGLEIRFVWKNGDVPED